MVGVVHGAFGSQRQQLEGGWPQPRWQVELRDVMLLSNQDALKGSYKAAVRNQSGTRGIRSFVPLIS